jgi:ubiquinone/menaquinone biosynthesis C-methylase UbiE
VWLFLVQEAGMNTVGTLNASTRDQWIEQTLRSLPAGLRLLDAGAGEQPYRKFCDHLRYVSQDFGEYRPSLEKTGLQMPQWDYGRLDHVCDVVAIPEPDASFDAILCTEVFEHIPEPVAALREFSRLLRTGGTLILTAPFCSLTHFAPYHFATGFSRYFYEHHLSAHGFTIVELTPNGNYFEYLAQEVRRIESVAERYADTQVQEWERWGLQAVLDMLETLSERDQGSSELLAFGYHVRAVKR